MRIHVKLTEEDLIERFKDTPHEELGWSHFNTPNHYKESHGLSFYDLFIMVDRVTFHTKDGFHYVLKDRFQLGLNPKRK